MPTTPLPPAGPAWYPAVMGTGILATLLQLHAGGPSGTLHAAAVAVLAVAWALLAALSGAFALRVTRRPGALRATVTDRAVLPLWGTVAMGLLAVGGATATVLSTIAPRAAPAAVTVDAVLWTAGTALGLATALGFSAVLLRARPGDPTPVWGLPIVPPMVSATTGTALVPHLDGAGARFVLVLATAVCFVVALVLGVVVFGIAYHHHWRVTPLALAASPAAWIPLGIVGQSTAAAQSIAAAGSDLLTPAAAAAAHRVAEVYGLVTLAVGVPLIGWATVVTLRGFRGRMPFAPGWWALTFPVGTLSLGAHLLGAATGSALLLAVGWAFLAVLCGTWTLCALASARALLGASGQSRAARARPASRPVNRQPPTKVPSSAR